jgi:SAM-dependent methyltransferase
MTASNDYFEYLQKQSWIGPIYRKLWLYPKLNIYLHGSVLDVGCGVGDFLSYRANTVGVDINPKTVEWCRQRGLEARIMAKDELPFADKMFDGAILDNVVEHIEKPGPLLSEVHRVLRKQARLIVGVPGTCGYARDPDHKVFYSERKLIKEMSKCGFNFLKVFAMPLNLRWLESRLSQYCIYGVFQRTEDGF